MNTTNFFSRHDLCSLPGDPHIGVISISEPGNPVNDLKDEKWASVLRLYFHDIAAPEKPIFGLVGFSVEQANQILDWLATYANEFEAVYVHCAAGISRSAAVSQFIADVYNLPFDEKRASLYNRYVYSILARQYTKRLYGEE